MARSSPESRSQTANTSSNSSSDSSSRDSRSSSDSSSSGSDSSSTKRNRSDEGGGHNNSSSSESSSSDGKSRSSSRPEEGQRLPATRAQQSVYAGEDVDDKINRTGCASSYELLTDCLGNYDRDWSKCQKELHAFRRCCRANNVPGA